MSGKGAVGLDECMPKIVDVEGGGAGVWSLEGRLDL